MYKIRPSLEFSEKWTSSGSVSMVVHASVMPFSRWIGAFQEKILPSTPPFGFSCWIGPSKEIFHISQCGKVSDWTNQNRPSVSLLFVGLYCHICKVIFCWQKLWQQCWLSLPIARPQVPNQALILLPARKMRKASRVSRQEFISRQVAGGRLYVKNSFGKGGGDEDQKWFCESTEF